MLERQISLLKLEILESYMVVQQKRVGKERIGRFGNVIGAGNQRTGIAGGLVVIQVEATETEESEADPQNLAKTQNVQLKNVLGVEIEITLGEGLVVQIGEVVVDPADTRLGRGCCRCLTH